MIIAFILMLIGWLFAVVIFEALYQAFKAHLPTGKKALLCTAWWTALGLVALSLGMSGTLIHLIVLALLGVSHVHTARQQEQIITVIQVIQNIPVSFRRWTDRIRPYLK